MRICGSIAMTEDDFLGLKSEVYDAIVGKGDIEQFENDGLETAFSFSFEEGNPWEVVGPLFDKFVEKKSNDEIDQAQVLGPEKIHLYFRQGWWTKLGNHEIVERALMVKGQIFEKFISKCVEDQTDPAKVLTNLMLMTIIQSTKEAASQNLELPAEPTIVTKKSAKANKKPAVKKKKK